MAIETLHESEISERAGSTSEPHSSPTDRIEVILNDRVLFRPLTGVGHYARQLLNALRNEHASVSVYPCLSSVLSRPEPGAASSAGALTGRRLSLAERGGLRSWLRPVLQAAYGTVFRWKARQHQLYHEPNHVPIRCDLPTVTTIHDLSVLVHPEWHPADRVRWYEKGFEAGRQQTCRFIAASEFTRREMASRLGISAELIDVTYQAPRPGLRPRDEEAVRQVLSALGLPERFFLFVGTLEPRKNVDGLLEAFATLPAELRRQHPLVLAGAQGWRSAPLSEKLSALGLHNDTLPIDYVGDETLACLYTACTALVWPSFYEGFGLPPLEAMACGCPVIVSNAASLPEVVGDAGVLLDPRETAAWGDSMRRMAEDSEWREERKQLGPPRAARFSWKRCAEQTIACYRATLKSV
jgi:glycosyltransferase involved in cell wall biosynthesis